MPIYNLIEYSDNYSKTSGILWQYYRDESDINITISESFKLKARITGRTPAGGNTNDVGIVALLKYLSNFWRTLEMPLINCEIDLVLTCSGNCVITDPNFQVVNKIFILSVHANSKNRNKRLLCFD